MAHTHLALLVTNQPTYIDMYRKYYNNEHLVLGLEHKRKKTNKNQLENIHVNNMDHQRQNG